MSKSSNSSIENSRLPLLPLRGLVVFPNTVITIDIARDRSIGALQRAIKDEESLFVVAQRDSLIDQPELEDLYSVGVIASVKQLLHLPDQTIRILVEGRKRGILLNVIDEEDSQTAELFEVTGAYDPEMGDDEKALMRAIRSFAPQAARSRGQNMPELMQEIAGERNPSVLCDVIGANLLTRMEDKQAILECLDVSSA